jgi:uncharacterized protein YyaL (SSP411 family)
MSLLHLLTLVDDYQQAHYKADASLKASQLHITRARQAKNEMLSAVDVRQELTARTVLVCDETATTTADLSDDAAETDAPEIFRLTSVGDEQKRRQQEQADRCATTNNQTVTDGGLRQRNTASTATSTTTEEDSFVTPAASDPILLFGGMPPRDLKQAQQEANKALAFYVGAAHLLQQLERAMKTNKA